MGLDRIVCLANSYKHEHRCVAGIGLRSKKWVRLVGTQIPGCLTIKETCYPDAAPVELLDVFEAELGEPCGSNSHPEDVFILDKPWRPIRRFDQLEDLRFLSGYLNKGPSVLQGYGDRVYEKKVAGSPVAHSLEVLHPSDLWWWIRDEKGKRRNRAVFRLGSTYRIRYDFPVTDPVWLEKLHTRPVGIHSHSSFFEHTPKKTILTVSLSEPFEGFHYKLIAGVVNLPS
jgi:hypothetical protein